MHKCPNQSPVVGQQVMFVRVVLLTMCRHSAVSSALPGTCVIEYWNLIILIWKRCILTGSSSRCLVASQVIAKYLASPCKRQGFFLQLCVTLLCICQRMQYVSNWSYFPTWLFLLEYSA